MANLVSQRFIQCHDFLKENHRIKSSRQFAILLDFAPQSLNDILKGKRDVTVELCRRAICKYGLNAEFLFCGSGSILKDDDALPIDNAILTVVTDQLQKEKIVHVPVAAQAGYGGSVTDITFFKELPAFSLPDYRFQQGTHRCFDVAGDSMEPSLISGDKIVCSFIEPDSWHHAIKDNGVYVVVTKTDVVVKRVVNKIKDASCIELFSDNDYYEPFVLEAGEIIEIWNVRLKISQYMPTHRSTKNPLNKEFSILRETIDSQSVLIQGLNGTINALLKQNRSRG